MENQEKENISCPQVRIFNEDKKDGCHFHCHHKHHHYMGKIIIGTILIALGLSALFGISLFNFVFAFILMAIGIKIIMGREHKDWDWGQVKSTPSTVNENTINEVNIFSSANKIIKSENFKGGKIVLIFSGGKIDLSQAKTSEKNINMEVVAIFGGGQLVVPKGWKINSEGASIFGGYDTKIEGENGETTLNLKGVAIFGGIKVIN